MQAPVVRMARALGIAHAGLREFSCARVCASQAGAEPSKALLQSALLVTRAPVVLQEPSPFEREYYRFNTELSHRIQQPFAREHYFKKGSAAESRFDDYYKELQKTWDGDALIKSNPVHDGKKRSSEKGISSSSSSSGSDSDLFTTMPRTTQADAQNDQTSLERALDRTLYLVVKNAKADTKGPKWRLPTKGMPKPRTPTDSLHKTGLEAVRDILNTQMDLWLVSKLPIAVIPHAADGTKTYVLKARILAGEPVPVKGVEYAWLTREEIAQRLTEDSSDDAKIYSSVVLDLLDA